MARIYERPDGVVTEYYTEEGESWLLGEDAAVKAAMGGITVSDIRTPARPVKVWFGFPDMEITEQTFPYMTIDLIDVREDRERAVQGMLNYVTDAEGVPLPEGWTRRGEFPIPYDIIYQITAYSRNPRHDRQIMTAMHRFRTRARLGAVEVEGDQTIRRMELLSVAVRDSVDGNNKRVFTKTFTVRVSSELATGHATAGSPPVSQVNLGDVTITNPDTNS